MLAVAFLVLSTAANAESITLAWDPSSGTDGYIVSYGTASGSYTLSVDVGNQSTYTVSGLSPTTRYFFVVAAYSALGTSAYSNEVSGFPGFTDPTLTSGVTIIKGVHIMELRQRIDALRAGQGLPVQTWTNPTLNGTLIRAIHINELRAALADVYQRLGRPLPVYTDSLVPGATLVKAVHIMELRQAVMAVE